MRNFYLISTFLVVLALSVLGLRGTKFTHAPMDVFPEWAFPAMRHQPKYKPQMTSPFFADGRADRPLPAGVVPASYGPVGQALRNDDGVYAGKDAAGAFLAELPAGLAVDLKFLEHGKERYTIFCAPCHGALGDGNGITKQYGMGATPTYHDERLRRMADGEIFNTITHGKNNMLSYADKLVPQDRWAVVAYVRALQRAQSGTVADVPAVNKSELGIK
ncbi:MAG: cytochrome c [Opitutaceae bacterium]|jgi:mono/diheme cytochrome c family protein|nr:cytochrome c [Opitutaceae bacterium]